MKDKAILAELKASYEYLQDIIDNADNTQLKSVKELIEIQNVLADKYYEIYEKIKNENDIELYYEEDIRIAPYINADYINEDNEYFASGDLDWQKWWEDDSFIKEL